MIQREPKFGAIVCVKDECELIEANVRHLQQIGVSKVLIIDLGSNDGTANIIVDRLLSADVSCIFLPPNRYIQPFSAGLRFLGELEELDWVLFLDADEFWIPRTGKLGSTASLDEVDLLSVPRFNACLTSSLTEVAKVGLLESIADLPLFIRPLKLSQTFMSENPEIPWIRGVPVPKIMVRPGQVSEIKLGAHDAVSSQSGQAIRKRRPKDLVIVHIPFSTRDRFQRKLDNIDMTKKATWGKDVEKLPPTAGWHWWRWAQLSLEEANGEYQKQIIAQEQLIEMWHRGEIRSAREYLEQDLPQER